MERTRNVLALLLTFGCAGAIGCSASPSTDWKASNVEGDMQMLVVSGDGQKGRVATELPTPVVVRVVKKGRPVSGQVVNFIVTTASGVFNTTPGLDAGVPSITDTVFKGKVFAGTAITDSNGRAEDFWTLGARTKYPQTLEVRAADPTSGKQVFATFTATALPGPAAQMATPMPPIGKDAGIDLGNSDGAAGPGGPDGGSSSELVETVVIYDVLGNPVINASVTFTVTAGGGSVAPAVVKTASDGTAQTTWTLGWTPNTLNSLSASSPGVASGFAWSSYVGCSSGSSCTFNSGICADLAHDSNNCGWCGNTCPSSAVCNNGSCQCSSKSADAAVMSLCPGNTGMVCTDVQSDPNNCGRCGRQCATGTTCTNGKCSCLDGGADGGVLSLCSTPTGSTCTDLQSDPNNCGWCGSQCPTGTACTNGKCSCLDGGADGGVLSLCSTPTGSTCADLQSDPNNCGGCGKQCPSTTSCQNGSCQCPPDAISGAPLTSCGGISGNQACVNVQQDNNNCGSCGYQCPAQSNCLSGVCQCSGTSSMCWNGSEPVCSDSQTDASNCGYCGHRCPASSVCVAGSCQCASGGAACETANGLTCVDLQSDLNNCGGCGATCPANQSFLCREARCVHCPQETIYCPGRHYCTDPLWDAQNCGGCGQACKPNSNCSEGSCTCGSTTDCGSSCADLPNDPDNCGDCGVLCASGLRLCSGGTCHACTDLGTGYGECGGKCTDLRFDDLNCGTCGKSCGLNKACVLGECISGQ